MFTLPAVIEYLILAAAAALLYALCAFKQLGALQQGGWQGRYLLHAVDNTHLLHANVPNMIGQITGILAEQGVNISDMTNKSRDKYAYTLLDLEGRPTEETIEKLKAIQGVLRVRVVK